ncbi:hypothetical protein D3C73_1343830 [compost metagenome]
MGHFTDGIDVRHAGFGGGEVGADIAALVAGQLQAVGKSGLRLPAIEHQDQVVLPAIDTAVGGVHGVGADAHAFATGARDPLLLGAHAAGIQMHGAGASVAHIDVVFEGVVAPAQHRHRQAGVVLRDDGRARADQHAGP